MKKLLFILLPILTLSLASCKPTTPLRNTGDIYDITNYDTRVYCDKGTTPLCNHCESWKDLDSDKLHKARSVTCTYVGDHCHYCVTWVK